MWRYLADSVAGTSHQRTGSGCQDSHRCTTYLGGEFLIVACADGAGSASHSDIGAETACVTAVDLVVGHLDAGRGLDGCDRVVAAGWVAAVRDRLSAEAARVGVPPRQLACTLLLAAIAADRAVFAHVGDGAIVTRDPAGLVTPVFWPMTGEYANSTFFVTDPDATNAFQFARWADPVEAVAVFTDGLQGLALNYADRSAHGPFFGPLFDLLRDAADPSDLAVPFRAFLDSPAVNSRTDDDKTLVIAVRVADRGDD